MLLGQTLATLQYSEFSLEKVVLDFGPMPKEILPGPLQDAILDIHPGFVLRSSVKRHSKHGHYAPEDPKDDDNIRVSEIKGKQFDIDSRDNQDQKEYDSARFGPPASSLPERISFPLLLLSVRSGEMHTSP